MDKIRQTLFLLMACALSLNIHAQNVAVTNQLKAKYSIVEYNKNNGGWYLIGKQVGTETQYGFCNKLGKVIAFGGKEYKAHDAFIEFYMPDPVLKKEYDEWKRKHDEWEKEKAEYDKAYSSYYNKRSILAEEIADKKKKQAKAAAKKGYWSQHFAESGIFASDFWSEAEAQLLKQGIEKPVIREEPRKPNNGYKWVQYTYIQPQQYQEIDYDALRSDHILCSVKKNGLYGLANKNLQIVAPCSY